MSVTALDAMRRIAAWACLAWVFLSWSAWAQQPLKLGILSFRPEEQMQAQWQPFTDYLAEELQRPVELQLYGFEALEQAISDQALDLVITNSAHYVRVRQNFPLSGPLVTMIRQEGEQPLSQFAGAMIMRSDEDADISLQDLAQRRIAAVSLGSFGGYQMQMMHLHEAGVRLPRTESILITGMPHDAVVHAVLAGDADVGFIRSGVLEEMLQEGHLQSGLIQVVQQKQHKNFPYQVSTRLYPEWPVVMMPHIEEALSREIIIALLSLSPKSEVVQAAGLHGFTRPADYFDVEQVLRTLRLPPFDQAPEFTLRDLWDKHWLSIIAISALIVILMVFGVALLRYVAQLKLTEGHLKLLASVFTHAREGIVITDVKGRIVDVNEAFTRISGYERDEVLQRNPRLLSSGRQTQAFYEAMWKDLVEKGHWYGEIWNRRKTGELFAQMTTISAVYDAQGRRTHYVALQSDITTLKEHQQQLEHIAHYDVLTNLPNRALLSDRIRQAMFRAERNESFLAVVFLDLDGFKEVNDAYGHEIGDQLLVHLAKKMQSGLRKEDTLARIGGDEFVALFTDIKRLGDCDPLLKRILQAAASPVEIGDRLLQVSASAGVTVYPNDAVEAEQLIRHADLAMYQAKQAGKNCFLYFDVERDRMVKDFQETQQRIRQALECDEFVLHYQPKVNMVTGEVMGAEALIRWQHPEKGLLMPAEFLPLIENNPLSLEVDRWVLAQVLQQLATWYEQGLSVTVSANICARMLQQVDFVEQLRMQMSHYEFLPRFSLELEVLETSALEDIAHVGQVIHQCEQLGVGFALDDFGTGYSSLTYLRHLPAQIIKIDQSFVRDMLMDPDDLAIVGGVVGLATAFHRRVIAEGVESSEHGELLLLMGCELAQGYGIARPMPADKFIAWQDSWQPDPLWHRWAEREIQASDLQLLLAEVEHRAWVSRLLDFLDDRQAEPPAMNVHQCRFGQWYDRQGQRFHGHQEAFKQIDVLHHQVHDLGSQLLAWHAQGEQQKIEQQRPNLKQLQDDLIAQLRSFMERK